MQRALLTISSRINNKCIIINCDYWCCYC